MGATKAILLEELEREQIQRERDEDAAADAKIIAAIVSPISDWIPADKELPGNPRCVLATDGEAHFIACYEALCADPAGWSNAHTSDEIDSVITHWMELPEVPSA
jgi:hypothetical protein